MSQTRERKLFLGIWLSNAREKSGRSQEEAADLLGISVSDYRALELGIMYPKPKTIFRIADLYDCNPDIILSGLQLY